MAEITLFDTQGRRKNIKSTERKDFIVASKEIESQINRKPIIGINDVYIIPRNGVISLCSPKAVTFCANAPLP